VHFGGLHSAFPSLTPHPQGGLQGIQGKYEPKALLRNEEDAVVVGGLLVGLNTLDCNLCLKPERKKEAGEWGGIGRLDALDMTLIE
jgi:hypothetical protein